MSTLPFLLSVADELDNINSQSYMDDFGLGFHPHRQYYRTPTIQLSLPASTDWMQQERQQRFRSHKFYDETENNRQSTGDNIEDENEDADIDEETAYSANMMERFTSEPSTSISSRQKYSTSALNSNVTTAHSGSRPSSSHITKINAIATVTNSSSSNNINTARRVLNDYNNDHDDHDDDDDDDDDDNIDNSVRMYNLSKKCCKNYHRHAIETNPKGPVSSCHQAGQTHSSASSTTAVGGTTAGAGGGGYRLHSKCLEGNNSSSDESLQKVSSSIEFLTCFLLKRSRASSSSSRNATGGSKKS